VRATYRHFSAAIVDLMYYRRLYDRDRFAEHFTLAGDGFDHYFGRERTGVVLVTGHFGNWELMGAALRDLGVPLAIVAQPPESEHFGVWLDRHRRALGQAIIPKDNALPLAMKALRAGSCVAFLMDQAAGRHGVPVPFFDRPVQTVLAPAALALKLDVPLYAGYSTRLGDGIRYRLWAEHVERRGDAVSLTAHLNRLLEGYVRERPEQWWWFHKRFKLRRSERAGRPVDAAGIPIGS
ncbi:MAG: lysophospholipid acyltransferase family protein, partial [Planctomycetota bacterium]